MTGQIVFGKDIACIVIGTCVVDVLVRPIPLNSAIGVNCMFLVDSIVALFSGIVANVLVQWSKWGLTLPPWNISKMITGH